MKLPALFATAIATPILLVSTLLLPAYASVYGAVWIVYKPEGGPHPLADKYLDVFTITDTYSKLLDYWSGAEGLSFVDYTLPIVGLPLLGVFLSLFLTYKIARRLLNFFQLTATIG